MAVPSIMGWTVPPVPEGNASRTLRGGTRATPTKFLLGRKQRLTCLLLLVIFVWIEDSVLEPPGLWAPVRQEETRAN
jgi:hypothetical protein